jgi:aspartyl-tRNA(Asn)/glutamyl-tRNA(Gln) amidotransferase subunit B
MHELDGVDSDASYVDFNRAGVPLIEIVSDPDIRTPEEAAEFLKNLRTILQYLEVCDGNMEQGSFRCDANVSIRPKVTEKFGTKVELKNMNSFRHVVRALEYEIQRQKVLLVDGEKIVQETRLWDEGRGVTFSMRGKEEAHDYRYFPDPDLVPLVIEDKWIQEIKQQMPELPKEKLKRFVKQYGIPEYDAKVLTATRQIADYFEKCVTRYHQPKIISNWIMGDLMRHLEDPRDVVHFKVTPKHLAEMVELIDQGTISGKIAKTVFDEMRISGKLPEIIVEEKGLVQVSDEAIIKKVVQEVLDSNIKMVEDYRSGKEKLFGFFVGQVMKLTKGKANPQMVNEILRKRLAG